MIAIPLALIAALAVGTLAGIIRAHRRDTSPAAYAPLHAVTRPRTFQRPSLPVRARRVLLSLLPPRKATAGLNAEQDAARDTWYRDDFELPRRKPMVDRPPWSTEPMPACTDEQTRDLYFGGAPVADVLEGERLASRWIA